MTSSQKTVLMIELKIRRANYFKWVQLVVLEQLIPDLQTTRKKLQFKGQTGKNKFSTTHYKVQSTCGQIMVSKTINKRAKSPGNKAPNTMMRNISSITPIFQIRSTPTTAPKLQNLIARKTYIELWIPRTLSLGIDLDPKVPRKRRLKNRYFKEQQGFHMRNLLVSTELLVRRTSKSKKSSIRSCP